MLESEIRNWESESLLFVIYSPQPRINLNSNSKLQSSEMKSLVFIKVKVFYTFVDVDILFYK